MAIFSAIGAAIAAIGGAIGVVSSWTIGLGALGSFAIGNFLIQSAMTLGFSAFAKKLAGGGSVASDPFSIQGAIRAGGQVPRSFMLGPSLTAGSLAWHSEWGSDGGTSNAFYTQVIALSDIPVAGLSRVFINGAAVALGSTAHSDGRGFPVTQYKVDGKNHAWVKFYDGTQTVADPFLTGTVSNGAPRVYSGSRIGTGVAYAIVTFLINQELFTGFPKSKFVLAGMPLYDISKDTSEGGNGAHRWADPSTWGGDGDALSAVAAYNLARGVYYGGEWFYGLQGLTSARLPGAHWIAQIEKCRAETDGENGPEPMYRCAGEITVNSEIGAAFEAVMTTCAGRMSEVGGVFKIYVGAPDPAIASFTDDDIISTAPQSFTPFFGLAQTINGVTASFPSPDEGYVMRATPPVYSPEFEAEDGGRRLLTNVTLTFVPFPVQAQRLLAGELAAARRARRHTHSLPARYRKVEPGDTVEFTSVRNGYDAKLFRVDGIVDLPNCDLVIDMTEVDPADHASFDIIADYVPVDPSDVVSVLPTAQGVIGFNPIPATIDDGAGAARRPALLMQWNGTVEGVSGIEFEARLAGSGVIVGVYSTHNFSAGELLVESGVVANTAYEVHARYIPMTDRAVVFTSWIPVSTPDVRLSYADLEPTLAADIAGVATAAVATSVSESVATVAAEVAENHAIAAGLSSAASDFSSSNALTSETNSGVSEANSASWAGQASTSETNAAGFASSAAASATSVSASLLEAINAAEGNILTMNDMAQSNVASYWKSGGGANLSFVNLDGKDVLKIGNDLNDTSAYAYYNEAGAGNYINGNFENRVFRGEITFKYTGVVANLKMQINLYEGATSLGSSVAALVKGSENTWYTAVFDIDTRGISSPTIAVTQMRFITHLITTGSNLAFFYVETGIKLWDVTAEYEAIDANNSATAAASSEISAGVSETAAGISAGAASASEVNASTSAGEASISETNSATSATNAGNSETTAVVAAVAAAGSKTVSAEIESHMTLVEAGASNSGFELGENGLSRPPSGWYLSGDNASAYGNLQYMDDTPANSEYSSQFSYGASGLDAGPWWAISKYFEVSPLAKVRVDVQAWLASPWAVTLAVGSDANYVDEDDLMLEWTWFDADGAEISKVDAQTASSTYWAENGVKPAGWFLYSKYKTAPLGAVFAKVSLVALDGDGAIQSDRSDYSNYASGNAHVKLDDALFWSSNGTINEVTQGALTQAANAKATATNTALASVYKTAAGLSAASAYSASQVASRLVSSGVHTNPNFDDWEGVNPTGWILSGSNGSVKKGTEGPFDNYIELDSSLDTAADLPRVVSEAPDLPYQLYTDFETKTVSVTAQVALISGTWAGASVRVNIWDGTTWHASERHRFDERFLPNDTSGTIYPVEFLIKLNQNYRYVSSDDFMRIQVMASDDSGGANTDKVIQVHRLDLALVDNSASALVLQEARVFQGELEEAGVHMVADTSGATSVVSLTSMTDPNGEALSNVLIGADSITIDGKMELNADTSSFSVDKPSAMSLQDGIFMGRSPDGLGGSTFGLHASRIGADGIRQGISLTKEEGLQIVNAQFFIKGDEVSPPLVTSGQTIELDPDANLLSMDIVGGGGGGGWGHIFNSAAQPGGATTVVLKDGSTTVQTWTASGGAAAINIRGADLETECYGENSFFGIGGRGNRTISIVGYAGTENERYEHYRWAGVDAPSNSYGAGGGSANDPGVFHAYQGSAGDHVSVVNFDISALIDPKLVITIGAKGMSQKAKPTELWNGSKLVAVGGDGAAGAITYSTSEGGVIPAGILSEQPLTGDWSPVAGELFPDLGYEVGLLTLYSDTGAARIEISNASGGWHRIGSLRYNSSTHVHTNGNTKSKDTETSLRYWFWPMRR